MHRHSGYDSRGTSSPSGPMSEILKKRSRPKVNVSRRTTASVGHKNAGIEAGRVVLEPGKRLQKEKELFLATGKRVNQKHKARTRLMGNLRRKRDPDKTFVSEGNVQDHADILDLGPSQILENGDEVQQFVVVSVREPAADGYRVLGVEDVRRGRVVDDNRFP